MAEELAMDLEELRQLQSMAKRPRTLSLISSEIRNLEKVSLSFSSFSYYYISFFLGIQNFDLLNEMGCHYFDSSFLVVATLDILIISLAYLWVFSGFMFLV